MAVKRASTSSCDELVRDAVGVAVDLDVVVDVDAAGLPLRQLVASGGQRLERRPVELLEELAPADAELLHRPAVELLEQLADRGVQLGERKKVRLRSRARIQRWATSTIDSTFALSCGLPGRAGITTAP